MSPPPAGSLAGSWGEDPGVVALLLVACAAYVAYVRRTPTRDRPLARDLAFAGAMVTLVAALASPLDAAAQYLQWAHMAQHVLLTQVAALLLVVAVPLPSLGRATRVVFHPLTAFTLFAAAWWCWHAPVLYDAALRHDAVHAAEHLTLLATAVLWWACLFGPHRATTPQRIALTVTTGLHLNVLGALLTLTPRVIYAYSGAYGLSALEDQQLGGVLMWTVGGFVSIALVLAFVYELVRDDDAGGAVAAPLAPLR